ncbi:PB1 domain-containing protein [Chlamydoabsidia padenii]|nr:PB1 domain-containing protein [Chlamydoabsidia padenii]
MSQPDYSNMRKLVTGDIVIKCRYGKDIRRLTINQAPTYDELCLMMTRIFKLPSSEDITLKYTDNENDLISLLDDNDITHAVSQSSLLKVTVIDNVCICHLGRNIKAFSHTLFIYIYVNGL